MIVTSIVPQTLTDKQLRQWVKKDEKWASQDFLVTLADGSSYTTYLGVRSYKRQLAEIALIRQGADPQLLEEFGALHYDEGRQDESERHMGAEL